MPPFYQKFHLKLIKSEQHTNKKIFYKDLNSDGFSEKIISENKFNFNSIIFQNEKDSVISQMNIEYLTTDNELSKFEDYDQDGFLEYYFLTINKDSIFLNAVEYGTPPTYVFKKKFITLIKKNHKENYDISTDYSPRTFDINGDGYLEIYFYISSGYSYFPRKIYAYNIVNDTLYSSPESGAKFMSPNFFDFENDNSPELYFTTFATDNYDSSDDVNNYPDTSAWFMLLDKNLKFIFDPIEFTPRGTSLQIYPIKSKKKLEYDILVLKTSFVDSHSPVTAYIYDTKGELIKGKELSEISNKNITLIKNHLDNSKILFIDELGYLYKYNYNLTFEKKQKVINLKHSEHISVGNYDIDNDGINEYLFWHQSGMTVTDINFKHAVFIPLENSGLEFPSIVKSIDGNTYFWYKTENNIWYMLHYSKNTHYFYRHIVFFVIFGIIYLFLRLLMTLRTKKIKTSYIKLNKIVTAKTLEITNQKEELNKLNQKLFANFLKVEEQNNKINIQNEELESMYKEIKNITKFRELNTQMIVHDLKNPLNRIISTSKDKKADKKLYEASQYMLNLVENIISITKIEQTGLIFRPTAINLQEVIRTSYESTDFLFKNKGIIFESNSSFNFKVLAENEILKRIFINLFTNAIKYTPSGGKICVSIEKNNDFAKITVKDNGIGIKRENLDTIFEIYSQHNHSKIERVSSSGIGLFFVKNAIEALNGKIEAKSELNKGTSFIFTLKIIEHIEKTKKTSNFENFEILQLSNDEKNKIKNLIETLKTTELYEISKIKKLINNSIFDTPDLKIWKNKLEESVVNYNTNLFQKLISNNGEKNTNS